VYVPGGSVAVYFPSGPTVRCWVTGPAIVIVPDSGGSDPGPGPPAATKLPVSVAGDANDVTADGAADDGGDVADDVGCDCDDAHAVTQLPATRTRITRWYMDTTIERRRAQAMAASTNDSATTRAAAAAFASRSMRADTTAPS
jgi:hypothetical protein